MTKDNKKILQFCLASLDKSLAEPWMMYDDVYNIDKKKYILKNKYQVAKEIIKIKNVTALNSFLDMWKKVSLDDFDEYLAYSKGSAEITAALLKKRSETYSEKYLAKVAKNKDDKKLGLKEYSLADYKKIFTLTKNELGYCIKKYKGNEKTLIIPGEIKGTPVFEICEKAFFGDENLSSVVIENGVRQIRESAFRECTKLTSVSLPDSLIKIGDNAFRGCRLLTDIDFPKFTVLGKNLLFGCDNFLSENGLYVYKNYCFGASKNFNNSNETVRIDNNLIINSYPGTMPYVFYRYPDIWNHVYPKNLSTGDKIKFGYFPQKDDGTMEPIEWTVISSNNDLPVLLSDKILFIDSYDEDSEIPENGWQDLLIKKYLSYMFANHLLSKIGPFSGLIFIK